MKKKLILFAVLALCAPVTLFAGAISFSEFSDELQMQSIIPDFIEEHKEFTAVCQLVSKSYFPIYNAKLDNKVPENSVWHEKGSQFLHERLEEELVKKGSRTLFDYLLKTVRENFSVRMGGEFKSDIRTVAFCELFKKIGQRCAFVAAQESGLPAAKKDLLLEVSSVSKNWVENLSKVEASFLKAGVRFH